MAYKGYNVPDNAEWEEKGEKRERYLFHHTTHSRGNCRCDLEPKGQQSAISVPIDSGPFCVDQNIMFWDSGKQVWKILIVSLLFCDVPEKSAGRQLR